MTRAGTGGTRRDGRNINSTHTHARMRACDGFTSEVSLPVPGVPVALRQLARELSRLRPDWRDPERYFENRSELEHALRRLARQLEQSR